MYKTSVAILLRNFYILTKILYHNCVYGYIGIKWEISLNSEKTSFMFSEFAPHITSAIFGNIHYNISRNVFYKMIGDYIK